MKFKRDLKDRNFGSIIFKSYMIVRISVSGVLKNANQSINHFSLSRRYYRGTRYAWYTF